ncbi:uncharacterized protein LOC107043679 [Diachasma alloeum]|uniref:uncharacterized protein LOC107043679 n=1 Tax=Diachasma alloeum TaxID=454923 RepID=UPI0007382724|nr:uncharacterized protein LOC107043679 [Diachasma alloeum]
MAHQRTPSYDRMLYVAVNCGNHFVDNHMFQGHHIRGPTFMALPPEAGGNAVTCDRELIGRPPQLQLFLELDFDERPRRQHQQYLPPNAADDEIMNMQNEDNGAVEAEAVANNADEEAEDATIHTQHNAPGVVRGTWKSLRVLAITYVYADHARPR